MPMKWTVGLVMAFMICSLICGVCEVASTETTDEVAILYKLLQPQVPEHSGIVGSAGAFITVGWNYIQTFWEMLWWDYSFFMKPAAEGGGPNEWAIIKYVIFWPLSVAAALSLILSLRGTSYA